MIFDNLLGGICSKYFYVCRDVIRAYHEINLSPD